MMRRRSRGKKGEVRDEMTMMRRRKRRDDTTTTKAEETRRRTGAPPVCNEVNHDISWFVFVFFPLTKPPPLISKGRYRRSTTPTTNRQHLAPIDNA